MQEKNGDHFVVRALMKIEETAFARQALSQRFAESQKRPGSHNLEVVLLRLAPYGFGAFFS
jgi:hypothetical protein